MANPTEQPDAGLDALFPSVTPPKSVTPASGDLNNPGNIRDTPTSIGRYDTPEAGWNALRSDLSAKIAGRTSHGLNGESSILDLANVWAPKGDGANDPDQWAKNVAGKLNVPVATKIGTYANRVDDLAQAVSHAEGTTKVPFKPGPDPGLDALFAKPAAPAPTASSDGDGRDDEDLTDRPEYHNVPPTRYGRDANGRLVSKWQLGNKFSKKPGWYDLNTGAATGAPASEATEPAAPFPPASEATEAPQATSAAPASAPDAGLDHLFAGQLYSKGTLDLRGKNVQAIAGALKPQAEALAAEKAQLDALQLPDNLTQIQETINQEAQRLDQDGKRLDLLNLPTRNGGSLAGKSEIDDYNARVAQQKRLVDSFNTAVKAWQQPKFDAYNQKVAQFQKLTDAANTQIGTYQQDVDVYNRDLSRQNVEAQAAGKLAVPGMELLGGRRPGTPQTPIVPYGLTPQATANKAMLPFVEKESPATAEAFIRQQGIQQGLYNQELTPPEAFTQRVIPEIPIHPGDYHQPVKLNDLLGAPKSVLGGSVDVPDMGTVNLSTLKTIANTITGQVTVENAGILIASAFGGAGLTALANSEKVATLLRAYPKLAPVVAQALDITARGAVPAGFGISQGGTGIAGLREAADLEAQGKPQEATDARVAAFTNLVMAAASLAGAAKAGMNTGEMHTSGAGEPVKNAPYEGALQPNPSPAQAKATAATLEQSGNRLAAISWEDLAEGHPQEISIGGKVHTIEPVADPTGKAPNVFTVNRPDGSVRYTGEWPSVEHWLRQLDATVQPMVGLPGSVPPGGLTVAIDVSRNLARFTADPINYTDSSADVAPTLQEPSLQQKVESLLDLRAKALERAQAMVNGGAPQGDALAAKANTEAVGYEKQIAALIAEKNPFTPPQAAGKTATPQGKAVPILQVDPRLTPNLLPLQQQRAAATTDQEKAKIAEQIRGVIGQSLRFGWQVPPVSNDTALFDPSTAKKGDIIPSSQGNLTFQKYRGGKVYFSVEGQSDSEPLPLAQFKGLLTPQQAPEKPQQATPASFVADAPVPPVQPSPAEPVAEPAQGVSAPPQPSPIATPGEPAAPSEPASAIPLGDYTTPAGTYKVTESDPSWTRYELNGKSASVPTSTFQKIAASATQAPAASPETALPPAASPETPGTAAPAGTGEAGSAPAAHTTPVVPTTTQVAPGTELHDFSSTQVNLPTPVADQVRAFAARIPDAALAEDGRETNPHVTVLYGLHGEEPEAVKKLLANQGPITVTIGKASVFPPSGPGKPAVVKLDVDSPELHRLNGIISTLEHTNTHPEYHPHITLAYVKPEAVDGFMFKGLEGAEVDTPLTGQKITLNSIAFSDKAGKQTEIPLTGKTSAEPPAKPPAGGAQATTQSSSSEVPGVLPSPSIPVSAAGNVAQTPAATAPEQQITNFAQRAAQWSQGRKTATEADLAQLEALAQEMNEYRASTNLQTPANYQKIEALYRETWAAINGARTQRARIQKALDAAETVPQPALDRYPDLKPAEGAAAPAEAPAPNPPTVSPEQPSRLKRELDATKEVMSWKDKGKKDYALKYIDWWRDGKKGAEPKGSTLAPPVVKAAKESLDKILEPVKGVNPSAPESGSTAPPAASTVAQEGAGTAQLAKSEKPAPPGPIPSGHWMNEGDIDQAVERYKNHPVLSRATKFLSDLRDETDAHSDGWPYWKLPIHAAQQLMGMIQHPEYATEANYKKALAPIRAFYTRAGNKAGMKFPETGEAAAVTPTPAVTEHQLPGGGKIQELQSPELRFPKGAKVRWDNKGKVEEGWINRVEGTTAFVGDNATKPWIIRPVKVDQLELLEAPGETLASVGQQLQDYLDHIKDAKEKQYAHAYAAYLTTPGLKVPDHHVLPNNVVYRISRAIETITGMNRPAPEKKPVTPQIVPGKAAEPEPADTHRRPSSEPATTAAPDLAAAAGLDLDDLVNDIAGELGAERKPAPKPVTRGISSEDALRRNGLTPSTGPIDPNHQSPKPSNPLAASVEAELAARREKIRQRKENQPIQARNEQENAVDPGDLKFLTKLGASHILEGQKDYQSWVDGIMQHAGDVVTDIADQAGMTPQEVLRQVHGFARAIAEKLGVSGVKEAPPSTIEKPGEKPTIESEHGEPSTQPAGTEGGGSPEGIPSQTVPATGEQPQPGTDLPADVGGLHGPTAQAGSGAEAPVQPGAGVGSGSGIPPKRKGSATPGRRPNGKRSDYSHDYQITEGDHLGEGSLHLKAQQNVDALRILKACETEKRPATPEEQKQLARYTGWGAHPKVFEKYDYLIPPEYKPIRQALDELLTPAEFKAAAASTVNAHYTSPIVVRGMWDALRAMGMQGGERTLEPAMGTGNFFGLEPEDLRKGGNRTGVELDTVTGGIAKLLYPGSIVHVMGFEAAPLPGSFYDVAIGNVPFGNYPVIDSKYPSFVTRSIHNYFFAKALDSVREGGVVAFITSSHTMDGNPRMREYLAERADLLGAVRLPHNAFKENAGTQVTTDIIFLRRRAAGAERAGEPWTGLKDIQVPDKRTNYSTGNKTIGINEYYGAHPEMMLGSMIVRQGQNGREVNALEGNVTPENLAGAVQNLPTDVLQSAVHEEEAEPRIPISTLDDPSAVKDGGYVVQTTSPGGKVHHTLMKREGNELRAANLNDRQTLRVRGMITVRDAWRNVLQKQEDGADQEVKAARRLLNTAYDAFVRANGPLSSRDNFRAFADDPDAPGLLSLEDYDSKTKVATKADIFSKRTNTKYVPPETAPDTPAALAIALNEFGGINWKRIQQLTGLKREAAEQELVKSGLVYRNPEGEKFETADEYLSGDVRDKLRVATAAADTDPEYQHNVEALQKVQPVDLGPGDIDARLGANWIPKEVIAQFVTDTLHVGRVQVGHAAEIATWNVQAFGDIANATNQAEYGGSGFDGVELVGLAMDLKAPTVRVPGETKDSTVVDPVLTAAIREKQQKLKDLFRKWVWEDPARAERLAGIYNQRYNNLRLREFDGSHMQFPGMSEAVKLRQHQKNAIWRMLQGGNTLLAHVVGAGKTYAMAAAAMEMRRLGTIRKPMFVVPNHLVGQWAKEFMQLYPSAKLFVADKETFGKGKREQAMSRIANNDHDAVIVSHSSFGKLPVSDETFNGWVQGQIQELEDAIREMKSAEGDRGPTVKDLEKAKKRLEAKLHKRAKREAKDKTLTFEEMGVDQMFVDEAHLFKNLYFLSKMTRIAGLPNTESNRAIDMYLKTQWLTAKRNGSGVVFATGTPIANTMAEMYTMQRYLQGKELKRSGLGHFDAWASQYGEGVTSLELAPDGSGYRMNTRFARFVNLPELATAFRVVADVQTADMLKLPVPAMKSGKPIIVAADASKAQKAYIGDDKTVGSLVYRAGHLPKGPPTKGADNMLAIVGDGRKCALDMRLVHPGSADNPEGKVNKAVDKIFGIWDRTKEQHSAQLVFCDLSTPKENGYNVYHDTRDKLIARGIPAKEIAFIHDYDTDAKKKALFQKVNSGEIRILMGSTEKMGAGMNVQKKLIALHHLDAPWRPSDIEQREGRILRQGNENKEVEIYRYVTKGSFDAYMWQTLEAKARFIAQVMRGDTSVRTAEDVEGAALTYAEIKGIASGNPKVVEKIQTDMEVRRLDSLRAAYQNQLYAMRRDVGNNPAYVQQMEASLEQSEADLKRRNNAPDELWRIGGDTFSGKDANKDAAAKLHQMLEADRQQYQAARNALSEKWDATSKNLDVRFEAAKAAAAVEGEAYVHGSKARFKEVQDELHQYWKDRTEAFSSLKDNWKPVQLGTYRGFELSTNPQSRSFDLDEQKVRTEALAPIRIKGSKTYAANANTEGNPLGTLASIRYHIETIDQDVKAISKSIADATHKQRELQALIDRPFEHEAKLKDLLAKQQQLNAELDLNKNLAGTEGQEQKEQEIEKAVEPEEEDEEDVGSDVADDSVTAPPKAPKREKGTGPIAEYPKGTGRLAAPDNGWYAVEIEGKPFYSNGHFLLEGNPPSEKVAKNAPDIAAFWKQEQSRAGKVVLIRPVAFSEAEGAEPSPNNANNPPKSHIWLSNGVALNSKYYDHILKRFPDAQFSQKGGEEKPVIITSKGEDVGLVMRLKVEASPAVKALLEGPLQSLRATPAPAPPATVGAAAENNQPAQGAQPGPASQVQPQDIHRLSDAKAQEHTPAYYEAAQVKPANIQGIPVLWVNNAAMDVILNRMIPGFEGHHTESNSVVLRPHEVQNVLDAALDAKDNPQPGGFDDALVRIANTLEQIAVNHPGPIVAAQSGEGLTDNRIQRDVQEELDHVEQLALPEGLKGLPDEMMESEEGKIARTALRRTFGYTSNFTAEAGVRLMRGGRYKELNLTAQQARDLATQYIEGLYARHGEQAHAIVQQVYAAFPGLEAAHAKRLGNPEAQQRSGAQGSEGRPRGPTEVHGQAVPGDEIKPTEGRGVANDRSAFIEDELPPGGSIGIDSKFAVASYRNGTVWMNRAAMAFLARSYSLPEKALWGKLISGEGVDRILKYVLKHPWELARGGASFLRAAIKSARAGYGDVVVVSVDRKQPFSWNKATARHEWEHRRQGTAGLGWDRSGSLMGHPAAKRIEDYLKGKGYAGLDIEGIAGEVGAVLAAGPAQWHIVGITPAEAKELFGYYADLLNEKHGDQVLASFRRHAPQLNEVLDNAARRTRDQNNPEAGGGTEEWDLRSDLRRIIPPDENTPIEARASADNARPTRTEGGGVNGTGQNDDLRVPLGGLPGSMVGVRAPLRDDLSSSQAAGRSESAFQKTPSGGAVRPGGSGEPSARVGGVPSAAPGAGNGALRGAFTKGISGSEGSGSAGLPSGIQVLQRRPGQSDTRQSSDLRRPGGGGQGPGGNQGGESLARPGDTEGRGVGADLRATPAPAPPATVGAAAEREQPEEGPDSLPRFSGKEPLQAKAKYDYSSLSSQVKTTSDEDLLTRYPEFQRALKSAERKKLVEPGAVEFADELAADKRATSLRTLLSDEFAAAHAKSPAPAAGAAKPAPAPLAGKSGGATVQGQPAAAPESATSLHNLSESMRQRAPEKKGTMAPTESSTPTVRGTVTDALNGIKSFTASIFKAYAQPRMSTLLPGGGKDVSDYERAVGRWSGADNRSALDLYEFRKSGEKAIPDKSVREAITNWIEAGGDAAVLAQREQASRANPVTARYAKGYENAQHLTQGQLAVAREILAHNDAVLEEMQKGGVLQQGVENYISHIYKNDDAVLNKVRAQLNFDSLQTKPFFTKKRVFATYFDAEQTSRRPRDKDVFFLVAAHERALREALAAREFIKELKDGSAVDGRPLVMTSWATAREIPADDAQSSVLVRPNVKKGDEAADYRMLNHPALRGWRWAGEDANGNPIIVQGEMLVHPEIYRHLKNNLTKGAVSGFAFEAGGHVFRPGQAALQGSGAIKHIILSLTRFHETTLEFHALEHRTVPWFLDKLDMTDPDQRLLVDSGLMVAHYEGMDAFAEGLAGGGPLAKIPGIGYYIQAYSDHLFKEKLPQLKMATGLHALARNRERYTPDGYSDAKIAQITAKEMNAAFGGLNYRMMGRNRTMQEVMRLIFMAPDFLEARAKFVAEAFRPQGREQLWAYLLGAVALYAIFRMLNEVVDRKPHWDKPFALVHDGKEYSMRSVQEDTWVAVTRPGQFLHNRLSPPTSFLQDFTEGRSRFGAKQTFGQQAVDALRGNVPIPIQPWLRPSKDSTAQRVAETMLRGIGVNVKAGTGPKKPTGRAPGSFSSLGGNAFGNAFNSSFGKF
jgi:N12 class adenine-specific DNA methylase/2'-5' RNA ligase